LILDVTAEKDNVPEAEKDAVVQDLALHTLPNPAAVIQAAKGRFP
jgi:hypothetical protein